MKAAPRLTQQQPASTQSALVSLCFEAASRRSFACTATSVAEEASTEGSVAATEVDVQEELLPQSRLKLIVTVPAQLCTKAYQRALRRTADQNPIPGFRKGKKVPEKMLFDHVGGRKVVIEEAVNQVLMSTLPQAAKNYQGRIIQDSDKIDNDGDELIARFDPTKSFVYNIVFDIMPTLSWRASYKGLKVEVAHSELEGKEEQAVEKRLLAARKERGKLHVVQGRGLQQGDVAMLDMVARIAATGEPVQGAQQQGLQLDTDNPEGTLSLAGVVEGLLGAEVGQQRTLALRVPDTWFETELRGSDLEVDFTLKELFKYDLPELTDELARELSSECTSVADLREKLLEAERQRTAEDTADRVNEALATAISDILDVDVPESIIREVASNEYQAQLLEAQAKGAIRPEMLEQLATEELLENFIRTRRDYITVIQRSIMGFQHIYQQEGLSVSEEEVEAEVQTTAGKADAVKHKLEIDKLREQVTEVLMAAKVLQWLTDNSEIVFVDPAA